MCVFIKCVFVSVCMYMRKLKENLFACSQPDQRFLSKLCTLVLSTAYPQPQIK